MERSKVVLTHGSKCARLLKRLKSILMSEAKFERPEIKVSPSGVAFVSASDILMSRVGREEIDKVSKIVVSRIIKRVTTKSGGDKVSS